MLKRLLPSCVYYFCYNTVTILKIICCRWGSINNSVIIWYASMYPEGVSIIVPQPTITKNIYLIKLKQYLITQIEVNIILSKICTYTITWYVTVNSNYIIRITFERKRRNFCCEREKQVFTSQAQAGEWTLLPRRYLFVALDTFRCVRKWFCYCDLIPMYIDCIYVPHVSMYPLSPYRLQIK